MEMAAVNERCARIGLSPAYSAATICQALGIDYWQEVRRIRQQHLGTYLGAQYRNPN
jgi:hypothetical protein